MTLFVISCVISFFMHIYSPFVFSCFLPKVVHGLKFIQGRVGWWCGGKMVGFCFSFFLRVGIAIAIKL